MTQHGVDTEVGQLQTVMLHRPGPELKRLTPRNNDKLLFDGIPWVSRAQDEHDAFAEALRSRGVEVLYLNDLLIETLAAGADARELAIVGVTKTLHLGDTMAEYLFGFLHELSAEDLALFLTAGVRNDEVRGGFGLVTSLLASDDFLIDPLPNLLFTRDSSVWIRDRVAITSLAMPARKRETQLTELIYSKHPRFVGTPSIHGWHHENVEGGDVLLLAPGVIAVGVGERTTPAGVERLARQVFEAELAHTVLAVPIAQERATMHLDTVCTMVDFDKIVMYPNVAHQLQAYAITEDAPGVLVVSIGRAVPGRCREGDGHRHPAPDRHRPRPRHRRTRAVGRRQQHPRHRPTCGSRLRAQRRDQRPARGVRDRGREDRRLRARLRPRRPALYVVPDLASPATARRVAAGGRDGFRGRALVTRCIGHVRPELIPSQLAALGRDITTRSEGISRRGSPTPPVPSQPSRVPGPRQLKVRPPTDALLSARSWAVCLGRSLQVRQRVAATRRFFRRICG